LQQTSIRVICECLASETQSKLESVARALRLTAFVSVTSFLVLFRKGSSF